MLLVSFWEAADGDSLEATEVRGRETRIDISDMCCLCRGEQQQLVVSCEF